MTKEQFAAGHTEFEESYYEYGVKFLPRHNDVAEHGSLEHAKAALLDAPGLRAVRRVPPPHPRTRPGRSCQG